MSFLILLKEFSDEFSHTVMHGVKLKKKLDPSPGGAVRPPVVPARPPSGRFCYLFPFFFALQEKEKKVNNDFKLSLF